jgi:hypothetical protein
VALRFAARVEDTGYQVCLADLARTRGSLVALREESEPWPMHAARSLALAVIQRALDDIALRIKTQDKFRPHAWCGLQAGDLVCVEEVLAWLSTENCEFWCDLAGLHPDDVAREAERRMRERDDAIWLM